MNTNPTNTPVPGSTRSRDRACRGGVASRTKWHPSQTPLRSSQRPAKSKCVTASRITAQRGRIIPYSDILVSRIKNRHGKRRRRATLQGVSGLYQELGFQRDGIPGDVHPGNVLRHSHSKGNYPVRIQMHSKCTANQMYMNMYLPSSPKVTQGDKLTRAYM